MSLKRPQRLSKQDGSARDHPTIPFGISPKSRLHTRLDHPSRMRNECILFLKSLTFVTLIICAIAGKSTKSTSLGVFHIALVKEVRL